MPVIRLIAALLRSKPDIYEFPSNGGLQEALRKLGKKKSTKYLHRVFRKLWLCQWPSTTGGNFTDPTIAFLGLYTLQESGDFSPPKDVTPVIAMLHRAIQLTALNEFHKRKSKDDFDELEEIQALHSYVTSHRFTTFSDLVSLTKYASKIILSNVGLPKSIFPNRRNGDYDTMRYDGHEITVKQLQSIYACLEERATKLWEIDVLLGLKLRVEYDVLADDLSCSTGGHSLFDNPNNPFKARMSDLWNAIFTSPKLFSEFMKRTPSGGWELNLHRLKLWLEKLAELESYILLGVEMKSGAPIRVAELVSTLLRNGNTRIRNVMGIGRHLALIRQYSKNSNNTQLDGLIPSGMDGFNQDLYIQMVTFARPVAVVRTPLLTVLAGTHT